MARHEGIRPARRFLGTGQHPELMHGHDGLADTHPDPMESMGNLFDVAILIGVGFMIVALSGFGLQEILSEEQVTIVKNPGTANMEIITKKGSTIERLKSTDQAAQGTGTAVGTVYRLRDGQMIWVPGNSADATETGTIEEDAAGAQDIVPSESATTTLP